MPPIVRPAGQCFYNASVFTLLVESQATNGLFNVQPKKNLILFFTLLSFKTCVTFFIGKYILKMSQWFVSEQSQ